MNTKRKARFVALLCASPAIPSSLASTWYVNANATGANTGGSWTNAFTDLQDALPPTNTNWLAGDDIWVAKSTPAQPAYKPSARHPNDTDPRHATFYIPPGVRVYGGFVGGETALTQRNPEVNKTILDGDLAGDDDDGQFPDGPAAMYDDNSYHVVFFQNTESQFETKLSGFIIRHGRADSASSYDDRTGAGVIALWDPGQFITAPLLNRLVIEHNYAEERGAGVQVAGKGPTYLTNCRIQHNVVNIGYGAGLYAGDHNNENSGVFEFVLQNCIFYGNEINQGSGAGVAYGRAQVSNCTFFGNVCHAASPDTFDNVGAYLQNGTGGGHPSATVTLKNCIVWNNTAPQIGARVAVDHCDVEDASWFSASGSIQTDPIFRDASGGNLRLSYFQIDESCNTTSPCIDTGDDGFILDDATDVNDDALTAVPTPWDFDKGPRVVDFDHDSAALEVDMGAYEECFADIDGDGSVGLSDLTSLLSCYGTTNCSSACCNANIAGCDTAVDIADPTVLLSHYGETCAASEGISAQYGDDPLADWLRSASAESVIEWWQAGMPPVGDGEE